MRRVRFVLATLATLATFASVAGCGGGYEDENRSIVAELPTFQHATLVSVDHEGHCSGDSCVFGDDRSFALVVYEVDTSAATQRGLAQELVDGLPGWTPTIDETCANADPSFCDPLLTVRLVRGDAVITVDFLNWDVGRVELGVDARGAG